MKILGFVRTYLSKYKCRVVLYAVLSMVLWLLSLVTPFSVGNYLDSLLRYNSQAVIWNTVAVLAVFWTLQLIVSYAKNIINTQLQTKICNDIKVNVLEHLIKVPLGFFTKNNSAYLNQRIAVDAQTLTAFAISDVLSAIETVFSFIIICVILFSLNKVLFYFLCALLPIYLLIYFVSKSPLYNLRQQYSEANATFYSATHHLLSNAKAIKLHEWQHRLFQEIRTSFDSLYTVAVKNAWLGYIINNIDSLIRYFANIGIFVYAGYQILDGEMSIGEFTMINSYASMLISYMSAALRLGKSYRISTVAYDRIKQLLDEHEEPCGIEQLERVSTIKVEKLCFGYGVKPIIRDLSFMLQRGYIYSFVGDNGSGKSTLMNILCGLEQDYTGSIMIDGIDLRNIDHHHLRKHLISFVEQEPLLSFKTLRENILHEGDDLDTYSYWIEQLNLMDFIASFDKGLDHSVSEKTTNLSGGEKQKFAIVRALVKDTDVLILDEPDSALDKESTASLIEILKQEKEDKIIAVVTHNKKFAELGDFVISLSETVE